MYSLKSRSKVPLTLFFLFKIGRDCTESMDCLGCYGHFDNTVSPLHTNLQMRAFKVVNMGSRPSGVREIAACPPRLLLTSPQPYCLPRPPCPAVLAVYSVPLLCASCCTALLYFSRCCTVRLKRFSFVFLCTFLEGVGLDGTACWILVP